MEHDFSNNEKELHFSFKNYCPCFLWKLGQWMNHSLNSNYAQFINMLTRTSLGRDIPWANQNSLMVQRKLYCPFSTLGFAKAKEQELQHSMWEYKLFWHWDHYSSFSRFTKFISIHRMFNWIVSMASWTYRSWATSSDLDSKNVLTYRSKTCVSHDRAK